MTAHGLMFHHFHGHGHPAGQGSIDATQLEALIAGVGRDRLLAAPEFQQRALSGSLADDSLCITFDDGLRCQFDVALPVLDELELTAFWFVNTAMFDGAPPRLEIYRYFRSTAFADVEDFYAAFFDILTETAARERLRSARQEFERRAYFAEFAYYSENDRWFRYLRDVVLPGETYDDLMHRLMRTWGFEPERVVERLWLSAEMLRALERNGHVVGLHSHTHPTRMDMLSASEQDREYRANRESLVRALERPPTAMAHPSGFYNDETLSVLTDLGIRLGFRADMRAGPSLLELPREDHTDLLRRLAR